MKTKTHIPIIQLLLTLFSALLCATHAHATDGTWTNNMPNAGTNRLDTVWSASTNWLNGVVADGSGSTAFFNTVDIGSNVTIYVTADTPSLVSRTNGNMLFGDTATASSVGNWVIVDGGYPLTLDSTTTSNSEINVTLATGAANNLVTGWGTATITANLAGTNTLVKTGPCPLILQPTSANTYSGGTIISNGMVQLGVNQPNSGGNYTYNQICLGDTTSPLIFMGGSVREENSAIPGNTPTGTTPSQYTLLNPIVVPAGQTGTLYLSPRAFPAISGAVTGSGTLNLSVDYVRDELSSDFSGFTGLINVYASPRGTSDDFRLGSGFPIANGAFINCRIHFTTNGVNGNTVNAYSQMTAGNVIPIGELSADQGAVYFQASGGNGGNAVVWQVGGLNTTAVFGGTSGANPVGFIKEGTGTWILTGTSYLHTGMMVVSNGVLQIGNGGVNGAGFGATAVISNYATIAFNRSDSALIVTNVITGSGTLLQAGTGTTTLRPVGGANTFTGQALVTSGFFGITNQLALGSTPASFVADQLTLNGGGLNALTNMAINDVNRGITLGAAGGLLGAGGTNTFTVANVIGGSGNLTITNSGNVSLTGANNFTGKTIIAGGTLMLGSEVPLGTAPGTPTADQLTLNGGTLNSTATFAVSAANRGITFGAAGGTVSVNAGTTLTFSEPVVGAGALTKTGAGTFIINGASTRTGNTLISQGTYAVSASGSVSGSPLITIASGATFNISAVGFTLGSGQTLTGNGTVVGDLNVASGSTLSPGSSVGILTVNGNLTMSGGTNLVDISSVTNDLTSVNGNLVLSGVSVINLNPLSALPAGTYHLIKYSGTLTGDTNNLSLYGYPLSRQPGYLAVNVGNKSIDLVVAAGSVASLVWDGGANGNAWDVTVTTNWLNGSSLDYFFAGDNVSFTDVGAANANVNLTTAVSPGIATVNSATDYTFGGSGKLTGLAVLNKSGADKLTILTTNDFSGGTTISNGTIQVGNGIASGSLGSGSVVDNAALTFNLPGALTVSNAVSGTGSLAVQAGTVTLAANNSYGASSISSGATLQAGVGGSTGSLGTGDVSDNGALVYKRTGAVTNSGSISGGGSLSVQGSGTVVLAANNSYSGPTTVDTGVLQVGIGGTAGTLGTAGSVTLTNAGTLAFSRSDTLTNLVTIIGTNGTLAQFGPGTLMITNDGNNWGPTLVTGGKLQVGDGADTTGSLPPRSAVTVSGTGALVFVRPDPITVSNVISGTGNIVYGGRTNVNIWVVNGNNTYSGATTVSNSYLRLVATGNSDVADQAVNQNAFGSSAITIFGNSTIELAGARLVNGDPSGGGGAGNFANAINVPAGQTLTLWEAGRGALGGTNSGAGTFNLGIQYVRGDVNSDWTLFTGLVNIITNSVNTNAQTLWDFRMNSANGLPNARLHLGDSLSMYSRAAANSLIPIGELTGSSSATLRSTSGGGSSAGINQTWIVGGLNTDATYDGTLIDGNSFVKTGSRKWTLTGANTFTGTMTVSNGVLALATNSAGADASISDSSTITIASPGVLDATGLTDGTLHLGEGASQTLEGDGTVSGGLYVGAYGTLGAGFSTNAFGNLTTSSNVVVDGTVSLNIDHVGYPVQSDKITAPGITVNGTINVTQISTNDLRTGDTFQLFSTAVTGPGTNSVSLPAQNSDASITYVWTNKVAIDGTVVLLSGAPKLVNPNPPPIIISFNGTVLTLSWPTNLGWTLQQQTNSLTTGLGTNWVDVSGSTSITSTNITVDRTKPTVFFRLVYP